MSSSDSEDDCYGNLVKRLHSIKNKYQGDNLESTNILNDSTELDKIVQNSNNVHKSKQNARTVKAKNPIVLPCASTDIVKNNNSRSGRVTRASAKRKHTEPDIQTSVSKTITSQQSSVSNKDRGGRRGRGKTRGRISNQRTPGASSRDRTRTRGDNRMSSALFNLLSAVIPTYSIGNTDEYPDQSDSQALFSNKSTSEDLILVENHEILEENEELSVKVYWQSSQIFKFSIRKFQKLEQVFEFFSKKENVSFNKLLFTYNDKMLKPDDTPDSINYNIAKFIDGGIVNESVLVQQQRKPESYIKNSITIKFQCQNVRKPFEIVTRLDDKFLVAMMKCAEALEKPLKTLKFEFDGDSISGFKTAREMELEGGECVDVNILS